MLQSYYNSLTPARNYKESGIQLYTEKQRNIDKYRKEVALRLPLLILAELDV